MTNPKTCPRCNIDLERVDFGGLGFVELDVCPRCKGTWFDEGELDLVDDSVSTNAEELWFQRIEGATDFLPCPDCSRPLEPLHPTGTDNLAIDRCPHCRGFWLDEGELDSIRQLLLDLDSSEASPVDFKTKPADWSQIRWAFYRFARCVRDDLATYGSSVSSEHRR